MSLTSWFFSGKENKLAFTNMLNLFDWQERGLVDTSAQHFCTEWLCEQDCSNINDLKIRHPSLKKYHYCNPFVSTFCNLSFRMYSCMKKDNEKTTNFSTVTNLPSIK